MNKYLSLLLLFLLIGCAENAPRQGYLKSDDLIALHFNKYQIKDLETVMAFFEAEICPQLPTTPEAATDCYKAFSKSLSDSGNFGDLKLGISLEKQIEVMASIRPVTFDAIWLDGKVKIQSDSTASFGLKYGSQYSNFLNSFGKENEAVKQYFDVFDQRGGMTPSMIASVLLEYEKFGLEDQRGRLVLAIHYLTLNRMFGEG